MSLVVYLKTRKLHKSYNKSVELINYPAANLLAHFKRYTYKGA